MILLDDSEFRAPLNTPQPLAKNAPLAFLMFSSIHLLLESEVDHQAPRYLAEWEIGNSILSDLMEEALPGTDGKITALHLLAFKVRLREEVREWMDENGLSKHSFPGTDRHCSQLGCNDPRVSIMYSHETRTRLL